MHRMPHRATPGQPPYSTMTLMHRMPHRATPGQPPYSTMTSMHRMPHRATPGQPPYSTMTLMHRMPHRAYLVLWVHIPLSLAAGDRLSVNLIQRLFSYAYQLATNTSATYLRFFAVAIINQLRHQPYQQSGHIHLYVCASTAPCNAIATARPKLLLPTKAVGLILQIKPRAC